MKTRFSVQSRRLTQDQVDPGWLLIVTGQFATLGLNLTDEERIDLVRALGGVMKEPVVKP